MQDLSIIILAAGEGKRMKSRLPKVLHCLGGVPLLERVVNTAQMLQPKKIYGVYGHGGDQVRASLSHLPVQWVHQAQQLGTGHGVAQALALVDPAHQVLVLFGDGPLISAATLQQLLQVTDNGALGLLAAVVPNPFGLGRIVRDPQGTFLKIVEEVDATEQERTISEIFSGILTAPAHQLQAWLQEVQPNNAQGEYYLTSAALIARSQAHPVVVVAASSAEEVLGVNDRKQLADLERYYQSQQAKKWMLAGVTILDPSRIDLRGEVSIGQDVVIDVNVIIEGPAVIGEGSRIGAHSVLRRVTLGSDVAVREHCVIEDAVIGNDCIIGPFARIRPETELAAGVHIGNFVEIKKSSVGEGSKINHLSYVGDATIGKAVNVGAGTITCNYDGVNKHRTIIKDRAFIGSDTQLVAPVEVGEDATIGAGSTITRNAPAGELTLTRVKQFTVSGWRSPLALSQAQKQQKPEE